MDIYRAQRIAEDSAVADTNYDKKFKLVGPGGEKSCEWLDPFMGLFTIEGEPGFMMVRDVPESCTVKV